MKRFAFTVNVVPKRPPVQSLRIIVPPAVDDEVIAQAKFGYIEHIHFTRPADIRYTQAIWRFLNRKFNQWNFTTEFNDRLMMVATEVIANAFQHGVPNTPVGVSINAYGPPPSRIVTMLVSNMAHSITIKQMTRATHKSEMGEHLLDLRGRGLGITESLVDGLEFLVYRDYSVHVSFFLRENRKL